MLGFQIHKRDRTAPKGLIEKFRTVPVANISDVMSRMTAGGARLRPMHDGTPLVGSAITVKTRPGDNLMIHRAIDMAGAGDVIIVDGGGDLTNSLIGEMMSSYAESRGIAGFVLDGAIRDAAEIRAGSLPIYAVGVTHRGPYKDGPGEINCAIAIDGMVVKPGDIIVGDDDGVLSIPIELADEIYRASVEKGEQEDRGRQAISERRLNRNWVVDTLKARGCIFPDDDASLN